MPNHPKLRLIEPFQDLPDPRVNRTKDHDLIDLLVIAVCTLRCAGESFNDMADFGTAKQDWFKTFLPLRNGIPSHDTCNRLFAARDPKRLLDCFVRWTQSLRQVVAPEIVARDGKALRRGLNADQSVKDIVSAWAREQRAGAGPVERGRQEQRNHRAARTLAGAGTLRVPRDGGRAMGCQKKIAQAIREADAD